MAKPFSVPDPKDRSVNNPSVIIEPKKVLGLYNQENSDEKKEKVVDSVKEWYEEKMKKEGWKTAEFHGSQCLLVADVELNDK